jgi:hypothetical protein
MKKILIVEPEYKRMLREIINNNMVHASFEAINCADDQYRGCLGHKNKHIDIMVESIWQLFVSTRSHDVARGQCEEVGPGGKKKETTT